MSRRKLSLRWSKKDGDFETEYRHRMDCALLHTTFFTPRPRVAFADNGFHPSFVEELENRGYDITTLRFSIKKKRKRKDKKQ